MELIREGAGFFDWGMFGVRSCWIRICLAGISRNNSLNLFFPYYLDLRRYEYFVLPWQDLNQWKELTPTLVLIGVLVIHCNNIGLIS